jgi:hypothetical protein
MEDFIFFFPFSLHFFLDGFLRMLKLPTNVMIGNVFVVMNVSTGSPGPEEEHGQGPDEEKYEDDAGTDEELFGDRVAR